MQVATLFRESSSLLGASMETVAGSTGTVTGTATVSSGISSAASVSSNSTTDPLTNTITTATTTLPHGTGTATATASGAPIPPYDNYTNHPVTFSNKYKLNMKLEPQDDGYETGADMLISSNTASLNHDAVKCEKLEDPYSFIDDDPMTMMHHNHTQGHGHTQGPHGQSCMESPLPPLLNQILPGPKKRGRKKKIKTDEPDFNPSDPNIPRPVKERKKHDRFNGMPEEEVSKRTLPDHLTSNLDIIIIGINPGLFAAYKGHHYAGPGNHFWKCLYLSGLTAQQMSADEDYKLVQVGIGFTNMVSRATKGSADLTRKEIKDGGQVLLDKLRKYRPKIAVFNGKLIYEVFSGKKDFNFGRQPDLVEGTNTYMWVMPSSSARCAQLPRAADKVPFYAALKKFRDYLNGIVATIDESELVFSEPRVKSCYEAEPKADHAFSCATSNNDLTDISNNAVIKKEDGTTVVTGGSMKKKRGRPKKIKVDGEDTPPPKQPSAVRKTSTLATAGAGGLTSGQVNNNCDFPKKKRGRPKKVKLDETGDHGVMSRKCGGGSDPSCTPLSNNAASAVATLHSSATIDNNTSTTNMSKCFSSPSPIQSPHHFYQMGGPALTPPSSSSNLYPPPIYCLSPRPAYTQSPRPHSQPFTHSDLSSEISAAISSEQLGSPASPTLLGAPDFDPPTSMAAEESRLSPPVDHHQQHQSPLPPPTHNYHGGGGGGGNGSYHPYMEHHHQQQPPPPPPDLQHQHHQQQHQQQQQPPSASSSHSHYSSSPRQPQDIASKSLSGLESLVDQIPSITDGESSGVLSGEPSEYATGGGQQQFGGGGGGSSYGAVGRNSPSGGGGSPGYNYGAASAVAAASNYPLYPAPTWASPYEPPVPVAVPLPYPAYPPPPPPQAYNYHHPYYGYPPHQTSVHHPHHAHHAHHPPPAAPHPPAYPSYLGGF